MNEGQYSQGAGRFQEGCQEWLWVYSPEASNLYIARFLKHTIHCCQPAHAGAGRVEAFLDFAN
jgi:hypothetical protein